MTFVPADASRVRRSVRAVGTEIDVDFYGALAIATAHAFDAAWQWSAGGADPGREPTLRLVIDPDQELRDAAYRAGAYAAASVDEAMDTLAWAITHRAISRQAGRLWMLHAACLAGPDGGAIALVAPSGTGKSTAALALGRTFGYVSDETTAVDEDGTIWPHPKPVSVVDTRSRWKRQLAPSAIGLLPAPPAPHLTSVVLLDRRGDRRPALRRLSTAEAITRLAEHSSFLTRMNRPLSTLAGHIDRVGGVIEIRYAEASGLVPIVSGALSAA